MSARADPLGPVPAKSTVKVITVKATVKITVGGSKIAG
jgi:hypothetical protein